MDMNLSKVWEIVKDREAWHAAAQGFAKSWTQRSDYMMMMTRGDKCLTRQWEKE